MVCGGYDQELPAFSVPDKGPLTEYEKWMPDFIEGLAEGIEKSRGLVEEAVEKM